MTISATYITLQKQIADELGDRTDLLSPLSDSNLTPSPIQNAIQSAIAKWEREPFYTTSLYDVNAFSTVQGQEFYTLTDFPALATMPFVAKINILINANRYSLYPRTWEYLEGISVNPQSVSQPVDWAYYAEKLRLYPIPDNAYPLTFTRSQRVAALVNDTDSNIWTCDAYDLIRSEAKLILARETLHDAEIQTECQKAIYGDPALPSDRGYLYAMKAETTRREGRGRIIPTYF